MDAAERILAQDRMHEDYWSQHDKDSVELARFVKDLLAKVDSDREKRDQPITREWLIDCGFVPEPKPYDKAYIINSDTFDIQVAEVFRGAEVTVRLFDVPRVSMSQVSMTTVGQMFDLLNAMKGNAT